MSEDLRSELATMRDEWLDSEEGCKCLDLRTLGNDPKYLRNRIEAAFLAGCKVIQKTHQNMISKCEFNEETDEWHFSLKGSEVRSHYQDTNVVSKGDRE